MLEVRNITVKIGSKTIIEDLSLQAAPGEVVAIVGPNGAGKSTFLKALCGDLKPSTGEIWMDGRRLAECSSIEWAQVRAMLPQHSTLSFPFSVEEVVLMGRSPHSNSISRSIDYQIAHEALKAVETQHLAYRKYTTLSGGEQQRVHLARVLAQIWRPLPSRSRYLLLDEPISSLDLAYQHSTLSIARNFARDNVTVVVILHDLNLAAQYADRILILKNGRQFALGSPQTVLTPEIISDAFSIEVTVLPHPNLACPLIVFVPQDQNKKFKTAYSH